MTRTLRFGAVDLRAPYERVDGHELEDRQTLVPPAHLAHGTPWPVNPVPPEVNDIASGARAARFDSEPWPPADPRAFLDEEDEIDADLLTTPVPRLELEGEPAPLPPMPVAAAPLVIEIDDVGTRTIMGVGPRAVRSVAKAGWVEAPLARREPRAAPRAASSQEMPSGIDRPSPPRVIVSPAATADRPSRRGIAHGSSQVRHLPVVRPSDIPPDPLPIERPVAPAPVAAEIAPPRRAAPAAIARPIAPAPAPIPDAEPAFELRPRASARVRRKHGSSSVALRVLGVALLVVAVGSLAAYIGTTVFFAFSRSWVAPVVVSQSDDKVVSLRSGLAAQQTQRDRLAAELEEVSRALAAQKDPGSEVAQKASAQRKILQASIARQDEIIRGLEQSPYLRALADRASVALVPYDNLARVAPGTPVLGCRVAMVMCREVGRVREILRGEVTFKHPRREKMLRGQMIELELAAPEAAVRDVLFLGGAPLRF